MSLSDASRRPAPTRPIPTRRTARSPPPRSRRPRRCRSARSTTNPGRLTRARPTRTTRPRRRCSKPAAEAGHVRGSQHRVRPRRQDGHRLVRVDARGRRAHDPRRGHERHQHHRLRSRVVGLPPDRHGRLAERARTRARSCSARASSTPRTASRRSRRSSSACSTRRIATSSSASPASSFVCRAAITATAPSRCSSART